MLRRQEASDRKQVKYLLRKGGAGLLDKQDKPELQELLAIYGDPDEY